jgi:phage recombination protein Bet
MTDSVKDQAEAAAAARVVRAGAYAPDPGGASLALRDDQSYWTERQAASLRALGIKDASVGDMTVFMHYCLRTGLDPFARQVYMIKRRTWDSDLREYVDRQTIQTGIDGFRVIRDRAARRDAVSVEFEDTIWYDADGHGTTEWLTSDLPVACRVVLLKDGYRFPAFLRTASYVATNAKDEPVAQWKSQGEHMIEKCCEAFASRRAFPQDLGGLYIEEEMQHEQPPVLPARKAPPKHGRRNEEALTPDPETSSAIGGTPPDATGTQGPAEDGGEYVPDTTPTPDQVSRAAKKMHALLGKGGACLGGTADRDLRLALVSAILRLRDGDGSLHLIGSTSELSHTQAVKVGDALSDLVDQEKQRDTAPEAVAAKLREIAELAVAASTNPEAFPVEEWDGS